MTYRERQRLADIQAAIDAIRAHLQRGDLSDGLVFDAVRIRLLEIGEAVKALPDELLDSQPSIPWRNSRLAFSFWSDLRPRPLCAAAARARAASIPSEWGDDSSPASGLTWEQAGSKTKPPAAWRSPFAGAAGPAVRCFGGRGARPWQTT